MSDMRAARVEAVLEAVTSPDAPAREWLQERSVQGLGVGAKITGGVDTGRLALRVYVDQKRPDVAQPVPTAVAADATETVVTDVLEIGELRVEMHRERLDPARPGSSVGNAGSSQSGTFGAVVRDRRTGRLGLLSSAHVLHPHHGAAVGDAILQPAVGDNGTGSDRLGALACLQPPQPAEAGFPNLADAAWAVFDGAREVDARIRLLGHAPRGVTRNVRRGMHVHKVGRTSDLTMGRIQDVHFRMHYRVADPGGALRRFGFSRQVLCTRFTERGDSGSLVLSSSGRAVGLHMAGTPSVSVFNRIGDVLDALEVDLVTEP